MLRGKLEQAQAIGASDYIEAVNTREIIYRDLSALLNRVDAVLCLASPGSAPEGFATTGNAICNGLWTYLGVPCVTLPRMTVDGLPMGLQLVGRRADEGRLLRIAAHLDRRLSGGD